MAGMVTTNASQGSHTEEWIKANLILPFLNGLGFTADEIEFEKYFHVKLGSITHQVGVQHGPESAAGRLDILCRRGEQNLFVIEVKSDRDEITQDDVEQGVSYARLLHPIAPFVLVTNGKESRVIDTITRERLEGPDIGARSQFWQNGCKLSTDNELSLRYEALKHFVGYSVEYLRAFSLSQVEGRMQLLKGSHEQPTKKYIPELFVPRRSLSDEFERFMGNSSQCLALVGESGVGKTNYMCGLAEASLSKYLVLFYDAGNLSRQILDSIREDFNWAFSPNLDTVEVIRRIQILAEHAGTQACIFIDAIDEAPLPNFGHDLDDLIFRLKDFLRIRLCVSCKRSEWERFMTRRDQPTHLAEALHQPGREISDLSALAIESGISSGAAPIPGGLLVTLFSDDEIREILPRYLSFFDTKEGSNITALGDCKSGFMLRVVMEVYAGKSLPDRIHTIDVLNKYLDRKLAKLDRRQIARNQLVGIARLIVEDEDGPSVAPGLIEERKLMERLGLGVQDELVSGLFNHNILKRVRGGLQTDFVGFYYTRLRDFIVAILTYRLHDTHGQAFSELVPKLVKGPVGQGVLGWYYGFMTKEQKRILGQFHTSLALAYTTEYARIIDSHFCAFKKGFDPKTQQEIGSIISIDGMDSTLRFAFRPMEHEDEQRVIVVQTEVAGKRNPAFWQRGVRKITSGLNYWRTEPVDAAKEYVREQLEDILRDGGLDETRNIALAIERITAVAYCYPRRLGLQEHRQERWMPRISHMFPIRLDDLQRRLGLVLATDWFEHVESRKYMRKHHTNTIHRPDLDWASIRANAKAEVEAHNVIPQLVKHQWSPPFSAAYESVMNLLDHMDEVSEPLLPQPDIPSWDVRTRLKETDGREGDIHDEAVANFSDKGLKKYLQAFLRRFLDEYRILVEINFPDLKEQFELFSAMPVDVWTIVRSQRRQDCLVVWFKPIQSQTDRVRIELWPEYEDSFPYELGYKDLRWAGIHEALLARYGGLQIQSRMQGLASHAANEMCVLRDWVYERIKEDLRQIGWLRR